MEKWKPDETTNTWQLSEGTSLDTAKHLIVKHRTVKRNARSVEKTLRQCGKSSGGYNR